MSRIYFHSRHGEAALRGSERAYMGVLCSDLMMSALGKPEYAKDWIAPLLPPNCYVLYDERRFDESLRLYLSVGDGKLLVGGNAVPAFTLALNTALVLGSDAVKLCARLHGQCELHCWIAGKDRAWLAGIIETGRKDHVLRSGQGWEGVVTFLRSRNDCEVVCSYSVCDQFPNISFLPEAHPLSKRDDDDRYDAFWELTTDEKWDECLKTLKERAGQISPDDWNTLRFDGGETIMSLRESAQRAVSPA